MFETCILHSQVFRYILSIHDITIMTKYISEILSIPRILGIMDPLSWFSSRVHWDPKSFPNNYHGLQWDLRSTGE